MTNNNTIQKKPKTLYLHIGYNKTGTTAIQNIFFANVEVLAKHGIFYPVKCRGKRKSPAHHSLAESLLYQIGKPLPKFVKAKIYSKFPNDHYWQLLHEELAETDCETIFISSEAFSRLRGSQEMMKFVKNQFAGYQVKILVYLRDQVEYFESAYNQAVKRNGETRIVDEMMKSGWLSMDYFSELEQWAEFFGAENMMVRIYDRSHFPDGSIVREALTAVGLPDLKLKPKWWRFKATFNVRLPNNMVETKSRINKKIKLPRFLDNAIVFCLQVLGRFYPETELLSTENKDKIKSYFNGCNFRIGKKYLNDEIPFQGNVLMTPKTNNEHNQDKPQVKD